MLQITEQPKATLFELDGAELALLDKIEALFAEPMNDTIDPGAEAERLVDEHLAALADVQEQLADKLIGYIKAIKAKAARAALLTAEATLYQAEAKRLAQKANAEADTADFLELRLKAFLERRQLKQMDVGTHTVKIVNQGGKLPLLLAPGITPQQVGPNFTQEIPASVAFDKAKIEAALKAGQKLVIEVPPAHSEEDEEAVNLIEWARFGDRPTKLKIS
ncbi:MAG TPA: siphovirus Gp157 family protein [Blastocatellia bacterium]|nr:siphovirus Gp157 family protein [Blastocatellia bacterium]HMX25565.1 siphovirus Gp157 family protein [Blastocatellia bacterium]HMY70298.1 siphovirus Gp157 family protein [Blastocatellia bacterium]HMZ18856.1 siphovirus Gp157 family protein [Blastocatellia bacterium]HNG31820.1 siphovirus Gp157 family protein [Blastocatellia bacterium]